MQYTVIIEQGPRSWGAWVPDIRGCFATGQSRAEVEQHIREAVALHLEGMAADGEALPERRHWTIEVEAAAPDATGTSATQASAG